MGPGFFGTKDGRMSDWACCQLQGSPDQRALPTGLSPGESQTAEGQPLVPAPITSAGELPGSSTV